ncbi:MAG: hypothetical protein Q8Q18_00755 [bacterium]|nr:hypothetical protein [bacterium]
MFEKTKLIAFASNLDALVCEAIDQKTRNMNRLFKKTGANLNFRISVNTQMDTAMVWENFGGSFLFRNIDGGIIILARINDATDVAQIPKDKLANAMDRVARKSNSPLDITSVMLPVEQLVMLDNPTFEPVALVVTKTGGFAIASSKIEAHDKLAGLVRAGEISSGRHSTITQAIEESSIRRIQELSVHRVRFDNGQAIKFVLDGDRIIEYKYLD